MGRTGEEFLGGCEVSCSLRTDMVRVVGAGRGQHFCWKRLWDHPLLLFAVCLPLLLTLTVGQEEQPGLPHETTSVQEDQALGAEGKDTQQVRRAGEGSGVFSDF